MKKTDTASNTYRGQDVLIEGIRREVDEQNPTLNKLDDAYRIAWNEVCDQLANEAVEEGLLSTEKAILALKDF